MTKLHYTFVKYDPMIPVLLANLESEFGLIDLPKGDLDWLAVREPHNESTVGFMCLHKQDMAAEIVACYLCEGYRGQHVFYTMLEQVDSYIMNEGLKSAFGFFPSHLINAAINHGYEQRTDGRNNKYLAVRRGFEERHTI